MATTTALCTSAKVDFLRGAQDIDTAGGFAYKMPLIKVAPAGTYGAASTNYSDITGNTDEVTGTGYTATGEAMASTSVPTSSGTTAYADFDDVSWTTATFSCTACMIYTTDATKGSANRALSTHDFGGTKSVSAGTFTVQMPTFDSTNAIIRIA